MKKYTFKLIVFEDGDEFWEDIEARKVTGCEEVTQLIKDTLTYHGIYVDDGDMSNGELVLEKFEDVKEDWE